MDKMDKLFKHVKEMRRVEKETLDYSDEVFKNLNAITDWTGNQAMFLGNLCQKYDEEYDVGSQLTLEWMIDNYLAFELERNVIPMFEKLYNKLVETKSTQSNQYEVYDGFVHYVKHNEFKILVHDFRGEKRLVIYDKGSLMTKFYVRKIWPRLKRNCINTVEKPTLNYYKSRDFEMNYINSDHAIYGDCRDVGHILTYQRMYTDDHGKCEHALWHLKDALHWLFEIKCVSDEVEGK